MWNIAVWGVGMNNIDIEVILSQNIIYEKITKNLFGHSFLILGDIGQGKKYVIKRICEYITKAKIGKTINMDADGLKYDYAPFLKAISEMENIVVSNSINLIKDLSKYIPIIGNVVNTIATQKKAFPSEFTDTEIDIINKLRTVIYNSNIVLVCNELAYWDVPSLTLIRKLIAYPEVLKQESCIICTDFKVPSIEKVNFSECFTLSMLPVKKSPEVIRYLIPNINISDEIIQNVCFACNGNIGILKSVLSDIVDFNICKKRIDSFHNLIVSQLDDNDSCTLLLDKASIIGCSAQKALLKKYTSFDEFEFCRLIDYISEKHLLQDNSTTVDFSSDSLWSIFNTYNQSNKKYHYDYAKCINAIAPAKYDVIAQEYHLAGMKEQAVVYYVLSSLHNYISYRIRPIFNDEMINMINSYNLMPYCETMIDLYDKYFKYELTDQCIFPKESNIQLLFETDYLEAIYLVNFKVEKTYYRRAYNKIRVWLDNQDFAKKSPEQWLRAAFITLSISIELHEENPSLYFEIIENTINKYIKTDFKIAVMHYDFYAKSNSCFSIDIAEKNVIEAVNFFEKNLNKLPSQFKYITALNNALANAVVVGRKDLATSYISILINYLEYPDTHIEYFSGAIINNIYIAMLLWSKSEFVKSFDSIETTMLDLTDTHSDAISKILYKNNLALFYVYCGYIGKANTIFEKLYNQIRDNNDIDDYYVYFIKNNYYIFNYIISEVIDIGAVFSELDSLVPLSTDTKYFSARNKYIKEKITCGYKINLNDPNWNDFKEKRIGRAWNLWGKWLLFSDIQFWGD